MTQVTIFTAIEVRQGAKQSLAERMLLVEAARYLCRGFCGFRGSFRGCWEVCRKALLYCQLGRLSLLDLQEKVCCVLIQHYKAFMAHASICKAQPSHAKHPHHRHHTHFLHSTAPY